MNRKEKIFLNTCKFNDSISKSEIEFRQDANDLISRIIDGSNIFEGSVFQIEYFQEGVASVVAKVVHGKKLSVIKITDNLDKSKAEALAFYEWKKIGINVPIVRDEGLVANHYFLVIDFYSEKTLSEKIKNNEIELREVSEYMGKVFADMQQVKSIGFGLPFYDSQKNVVGPTVDIDEYLETEFLNDKFSITDEYSDDISLSEIAREKVELLKLKLVDSKSELSSFDFAPRHFFDTKVPTLFDPDPMLVPKSFGVANLMMPTINKIKNGVELQSAIISSYIKNGGSFDRETIQLSLWLQTYRKAASLLLSVNETRKERALLMIEYLLDDSKMHEYTKSFIIDIR